MFRWVLLEGAIGGAVLVLLAFLLSKFVSDVAGRTLLATVLFAAAGAYLVAYHASADSTRPYRKAARSR